MEWIIAILSGLVMICFYYISLHILEKESKTSPFLLHGVGSMTFLVWVVFNILGKIQFSFPLWIMTLCAIWALAVLTVTDWKRYTIPNRFLMVLLLIWVAIIGIAMILDISSGMGILLICFAGAFMGGFIFFLCYILSKRQLGAGDVKLVFILGLFLTGQRIMGTIFYAMVLCCIFSIIQLCRKKIGMKDGVPLVPFLYVGTWITLLIL